MSRTKTVPRHVGPQELYQTDWPATILPRQMQWLTKNLGHPTTVSGEPSFWRSGPGWRSGLDAGEPPARRDSLLCGVIQAGCPPVLVEVGRELPGRSSLGSFQLRRNSETGLLGLLLTQVINHDRVTNSVDRLHFPEVRKSLIRIL